MTLNTIESKRGTAPPCRASKLRTKGSTKLDDGSENGNRASTLKMYGRRDDVLFFKILGVDILKHSKLIFDHFGVPRVPWPDIGEEHRHDVFDGKGLHITYLRSETLRGFANLHVAITKQQTIRDYAKLLCKLGKSPADIISEGFA